MELFSPSDVLQTIFLVTNWTIIKVAVAWGLSIPTFIFPMEYSWNYFYEKLDLERRDVGKSASPTEIDVTFFTKQKVWILNETLSTCTTCSDKNQSAYLKLSVI